MSLTGDLGTYGPPIDNGAQAAIEVINDALSEAGVTGITVEIVATEDDQTECEGRCRGGDEARADRSMSMRSSGHWRARSRWQLRSR